MLGLERFDIPHEMGSSHGETRIIRLAYFEHPDYVPLLSRAYTLWRDLESQAGETLLVTTGSIDASRDGGGVFEHSLRSCEVHGLPHEVLNAKEVAGRFPGLSFPEDVLSVFQKDGGFLLPERCIVAHTEAAVQAGAEVRTGEQVRGWDEVAGHVVVTTTRATYHAGQVVVAAGPWAGGLLDLEHLLTPERQVLLWVRPDDPDLYSPSRFPVFNIRGQTGHFYGFPSFGASGVKVGLYHHLHEVVDPDDMEREGSPRDEAPIRRFIEQVLPQAAGPSVMMKTCLFTNTSDEHFIVDRLPGTERMVVGAGFSGHGFKFASVMGERLATLALGEGKGEDIRFLGLDRFA